MPLSRPQAAPSPIPRMKTSGSAMPGVAGEQVAGHEGGEADDRADRQVDVARDDHERLADGEDREDRRVEREVAQRRGLDEARLEDAGDRDQQRERDDDAELADAEDALDEPAGALALERGRSAGASSRASASPAPVASRMTLSSSASARDSSPVMRPSCMTSTRSAMPSTSGSSLEIISTATPWPASSLISRCTSALVPTSMPRVGSSTISTFGPVASHLPSTTFCWLPPDSVPTLSCRRWNFSCSRAAHSSASEFSALLRISPARDERAQPRQRDVAGDREVHHQALLAAVLGDEAEAGAHGGERAPAGQALARHLDVAGVGLVDAEDRAGDLAAAGADEPGERDDLAGADVERDVEEHALAREALDLEHLLADLRVLLREERGEVAPDHAADHLVGRHVGGPRVVDDRAVAHDRDGVADREDLVEAVRDEQHGRAVLLQRPHDGEQPRDLGPRERGGRLVHDQHARVEAQRLGDLDDLLVGDREPAHGALGIEADAEAVEQALDLAAASRPRSIRLRPRSGWKPMTTFSATLRSGNSVGSW